MPKLVVSIQHLLAEDDPTLTDNIEALLRRCEDAGIVLGFSFANSDDTEPGREPITLERDDVAALLDDAAELQDRMEDDAAAAYTTADLDDHKELIDRVEAALGYGQ